MNSVSRGTMDIKSLRVYSDAKQGGRVYMEDVISVHTCAQDDADSGWLGDDRDIKFFAVYDGHGGPEAAQFSKENLKNEIFRQPGFWSDDEDDIVQAIKDGFTSTHQLMRKAIDSWPHTMAGLPSTAGTTASVVILRDGKIFVAHVGDSSVVFGEQDYATADAKLTAKCVTVEHKPDSPEERARIEQSGGEVVSKAGVSRVVWKRPRTMVMKGLFRRHSTSYDSIPFLAVSRALGDLWSYNSERDLFVVTPEPDVSVHRFDPRQHRFIIIASDGVWNMMSAEDAVQCVWASANPAEGNEEDSMDGDVENPAAMLVQRALSRWKARCMRADNTSAIVLMFVPPSDEQQQTAQGVAKKTGLKQRCKLTVKMSFHRRPAVLRKSKFVGRQGVWAPRIRWPGSLPASASGGVRRRVRRLPLVSRRMTSCTVNRFRPFLLGDSVRRFLTDRYHEFLPKSCRPADIKLSDRAPYSIRKQLARTASFRKSSSSVNSCECIVNSPGAVGETLTKGRQTSGDAREMYNSLVSLCKLNVDHMLQLEKVSLSDNGSKVLSSVNLCPELNTASSQRLGSEWRNVCASSDSCSFAARHQHDCIKRTRVQIEALRDG